MAPNLSYIINLYNTIHILSWLTSEMSLSIHMERPDLLVVC